MALNLVIPSKTHADNYALEDYQSDFTTIKNAIDAMTNKVTTTPTLGFGMNSKITSTSAVSQPIKATVIGQHYVNLLGKDGNFESLTNWVPNNATIEKNTTYKIFGANGIKLIASAGAGCTTYRSGVPVANTKYYLVSGYVCPNASPSAYLYLDGNLTATKLGTIITDSTKFTRVMIKLQPSDISVASGTINVHFGIGSTLVGHYGYADGFMFNEISAADYALTDAQLLAKYPYVDGYGCLTNPYIEVRHDNLVRNGNGEDNVSYWTPSNVGVNGSTVSFQSGYFVINDLATTASVDMHQIVPVKADTSYTLKCTAKRGTASKCRLRMTFIEKDGSYVGTQYVDTTSTTDTEISVITTSTSNTVAAYISISGDYSSDSNTGTSMFKEIRLLEGLSNPNPYKPCRLERVVVEGQFTGEDSFVLENGDVTGTLIWKHKKLHGKDFGWAYVGDYTGFKNIRTFIEPVANLPGSGMYNQYLTKYNGDVLKYNGSTNTANSFLLYNADGFLYLCVSDSDTGWGESIAPNADEIRAYMNGWKAVVNNGTRYWLWQSVVDNSIPQGAVQATVSAGYTGLTIPVSSNGTNFTNGDAVYCFSSTGTMKWSDSVSGTPTATTIPVAGSKTVVTGDIIVKSDSASNIGLLMWCANNVAPGYEGYNLHYRLTNPEPITDANVHLHGDIPKLDAGENYVLVDSGRVFDEMNTPYYDSGNSRYSINSGIFLRNKVENIDTIFRNGAYDPNWIYSASYADVRGNGFSYVASSNFDTNATYTVDYKILATIAPQIGTILTSYEQDINSAITNIQDALEHKQNKDAAVDNLIALSLYETGSVLNFSVRGTRSYYNYPSETQICVPIKMIPKRVKPNISISNLTVSSLGSTGVPTAVNSAEVDGGNPEIWSITKTDFMLMFEIKPGTKADNALAYGAIVTFNWTADCRGKV